MGLSFKPHNAKKAEDVAEAAAKCKRPILEPKYDGWRMIAIINEEGHVTLWSRTGKPYRMQTPEPILEELAQFPAGTILDGEMVDHTDNKNCTAVTNVFGKSKAAPIQMEQDRIHYIVFDCIELGGESIADLSLEGRRFQVGGYLAPEMTGAIMLGGTPPSFSRIALTAQAPAEDEFHSLFLELGYEGAMVKDLDSTYAFGKRGHGWFKLKATVDIDVVITEIMLDGKGQHEGKAGRFVVAQLCEGEFMERAKVNPYDDAMRNAMTADPESFVGRVCTIKHYGVLKDGLRHPTFVKWREDKPPEECHFDNGE